MTASVQLKNALRFTQCLPFVPTRVATFMMWCNNMLQTKHHSELDFSIASLLPYQTNLPQNTQNPDQLAHLTSSCAFSRTFLSTWTPCQHNSCKIVPWSCSKGMFHLGTISQPHPTWKGVVNFSPQKGRETMISKIYTLGTIYRNLPPFSGCWQKIIDSTLPAWKGDAT